MRPVKLLLPPEGFKIGIPGDMHYPVHDKVAVDLMLQSFEDWGINQFWSLGDLLDLYSLSKYDKEAARMMENGEVEKEIESAESLFKWCQTLKDGWIWMDGNHEKRVANVVTKFPGLNASRFNLDVLVGPDRLKGCTRLGEDARIIVSPDHVFEHGHRIKKVLRDNAAKLVLADYPEQNTTCGHTHRVWRATKTSYVEGIQVVRSARSIGHMSDEFKQGYESDPQWQLGFLKLTSVRDKMGKPDLHYEQVLVKRDRRGRPYFFTNGKTYK